MKFDTRKTAMLHAAQGKTQAHLAEEAGLTQATVSIALKRGTARPDTIYKIAKALNVDPLELVRKELTE